MALRTLMVHPQYRNKDCNEIRERRDLQILDIILLTSETVLICSAFQNASLSLLHVCLFFLLVNEIWSLIVGGKNIN
jgi:hypothetical protein